MREAGSPWRAFAVLAIGVFLSVLDLFIVNIAFPEIESSFPSASLSSLSWILSAYAIVLAAVLVPAGKLADIVGRKRVFRIDSPRYSSSNNGPAASRKPAWWRSAE
jgi:MFS family permease